MHNCCITPPLSIFIKILPHFIFNAKLHHRLYLQPPLFHIKTKTILSDYSDQPKSFFGEYKPAHYENLYLIKNYSDYKRDNKFSDFHSGGSLQQRQDFNLIGSSIFFLLISPVWQWTIYKEYWYRVFFLNLCDVWPWARSCQVKQRYCEIMFYYW